MRKTSFFMAAFLAGIFALSLGSQALAECAGHTKTTDAGLDGKTVVETGTPSTKSGG